MRGSVPPRGVVPHTGAVGLPAPVIGAAVGGEQAHPVDLGGSGTRCLVPGVALATVKHPHLQESNCTQLYDKIVPHCSSHVPLWVE